jgi:multiple sugar transport system permease protein
MPSSFVLFAAISSLAYFGIFFLGPFVGSVVIGLFNWDLLSTAVFLGSGNFETMASDDLFLNGLKVSFLFVAVEVPIVLGLQLVLGATFARMRMAPQKIYLTMFFLPVITPWLVAVMMFTFLFDSHAGLPAVFEGIFGLHVINPLASPDTALYAIVFVTGWKFLGYGALLFLVGINEIPEHLYEAATIDGAGGVKQFTKITWPLIFPILIALSITSFIGALQIFDPFFIMTEGGPSDSTRTFSLYLYQQAFDNLRFGYASAMAFFMFVLLLVVSIIQLAIGRARWEY